MKSKQSPKSDNIKLQNQKYIDEIIQLNQKIKFLENKNKPLIEEVTLLTISLAKLKKQYDEIKEKIHYLEKNIIDKSQKDDRLQQENEKLKKEISFLKGEKILNDLIPKVKSKPKNCTYDYKSTKSTKEESNSSRILSPNLNHSINSHNGFVNNISNLCLKSVVSSKTQKDIKKNLNILKNKVIEEKSKLEFHEKKDLFNNSELKNNEILLIRKDIIRNIDNEYEFYENLEEKLFQIRERYDKYINNNLINHSYNNDYDVIYKVIIKENEVVNLLNNDIII